MADGAYRWLGNAPEPDPARVAEIDAAWDDAQPHAFAEPARIAAVERIERAQAAARNADLEEAADRLNQTRSLLAGLEPHTLEPRRGLAGLFDSRSKRLKRFRETWRRAVAALAAAAAGLSGNVEGADRRSGALDRLWAELRDAVTELDAHLAVATRRLKDQGPAENAALHPLEARHATLEACRAAALQTLPLIRAAQNADARAAGMLKACVEAVKPWRAEWEDALGLAGKRPNKVRPDPASLIRRRDDLLAHTDRALAELSAARARHAEVERRMTALGKTLRP